MSLRRERAQAHAGGGEPAADILDRLNFIQWNRSFGFEPQQIARRHRHTALHSFEVFEKFLGFSGFIESVQRRDHLWIGGVKFTLSAPRNTIMTALFQRRRFRRVIGRMVPA